FDRLAVLERGLDVAAFTELLRRGGIGRELLRVRYVRGPAVVRGLALVPLHFERFLSLERVPPRVREDRDARQRGRRVRAEGDRVALVAYDERVLHARHLLDRVEIRGHRARADGRRLRVRRVEHSGNLLIDAEQRLAGDDLRVVDTAHARAEQLVVAALLER